jgi:hypothetical protein
VNVVAVIDDGPTTARLQLDSIGASAHVAMRSSVATLRQSLSLDHRRAWMMYGCKHIHGRVGYPSMHKRHRGLRAQSTSQAEIGKLATQLYKLLIPPQRMTGRCVKQRRSRGFIKLIVKLALNSRPLRVAISTLPRCDCAFAATLLPCGQLPLT